MAALAAVPALVAAAAPYISAASMVIGGASAVTGYMAQREAADAQTASNRATAASALQARNNTVAQLQTRALQERDAASEKMFEARVSALEGASSSSAKAAASGVEGNTVDALAREYWSKEGRTDAAIAKTANNTVAQLQAEQTGAQAQYEARLQSTPSVREPSLWGLGLGIVKGVSDGARDLTRQELITPKTTR